MHCQGPPCVKRKRKRRRKASCRLISWPEYVAKGQKARTISRDLVGEVAQVTAEPVICVERMHASTGTGVTICSEKARHKDEKLN